MRVGVSLHLVVACAHEMAPRRAAPHINTKAVVPGPTLHAACQIARAVRAVQLHNKASLAATEVCSYLGGVYAHDDEEGGESSVNRQLQTRMVGKEAAHEARTQTLGMPA